MHRAHVAAALLLSLWLTGCEPWGKPVAPQKEVADFQTLFRDNCSGCHGTEGRGGPGRILNDGLYLAFIPKESLRSVITPEQISVLVDGMERNWAKAVNLRGATLPAYEASPAVGDATRGKKLFLRDCFACHAKGGLAGPLSDPAYLSLTTKQNLRTSIVVGRPDLGMPDYRVLNVGRALSEQDIADLVTYLAGETVSR